MEILKEVPPFTHKAVITIYSNEDDDSIAFSISFTPDMEGKNIEEIGYVPAAYQLVQEYILPALEQAYIDNEVEPMMSMEPPSTRTH